MQNRKDVGRKIVSIPTATGNVTYYVRNKKKKAYEPIEVVSVTTEQQDKPYRITRTTQVLKQRFDTIFDAARYFLTPPTDAPPADA
jgi:hypothetical protein